MEISIFYRELFVYSLAFIFVGYLLYIAIVDDDAPEKKGNKA